jgi:hypothetical protein
MKDLLVNIQFQKYVAAVKMAELASGGCGELNSFDHVAKDLHEPSFDRALELVPDWKANAWRCFYQPEIDVLAEKYGG